MKPKMVTRRKKPIDWREVCGVLAFGIVCFTLGVIYFMRLTDGGLH